MDLGINPFKGSSIWVLGQISSVKKTMLLANFSSQLSPITFLHIRCVSRVIGQNECFFLEVSFFSLRILNKHKWGKPICGRPFPM